MSGSSARNRSASNSTHPFRVLLFLMDARHSLQNQAFTALSVAEASTLDALFEKLFPADENGPGASSIGVIQYLDRALGGLYAHHLETYRLGVYALDAESERRFGKP